MHSYERCIYHGDMCVRVCVCVCLFIPSYISQYQPCIAPHPAWPASYGMEYYGGQLTLHFYDQFELFFTFFSSCILALNLGLSTYTLYGRRHFVLKNAIRLYLLTKLCKRLMKPIMNTVTRKEKLKKSLIYLKVVKEIQTHIYTHTGMHGLITLHFLEAQYFANFTWQKLVYTIISGNVGMLSLTVCCCI